VETFGISERRACEVFGVWRSSCRYQRKPDRNERVREQLVELAHQRPRFGYRRLGYCFRERASTSITNGFSACIVQPA
jgi:putative transposase